MELIGQIVLHKVFGEGKIIEDNDRYITVLFKQEEKKFIYPDSFKSFLKAKDQIINEVIFEEIRCKEVEQLRLKEEADAKSEAESKRESERLSNKKIISKLKTFPRYNIAFKCNYCNGGSSSEQIGFNGVCSNELIKYNIEVAKHIWCGCEDSECRRYLNGEISRKELDDLMNQEGFFLCYESQMLRDWTAFAGIVQSGDRKGIPMKLNQVQCNSLAILTTRAPYESEDERFIFAVFLVDENYEGDLREAGYVTTNSEYKIKLSPSQAKRMKFWNYYFNPNCPDVVRMGSGLHRYITDIQAAQILKDIVSVKEGTKDEKLAIHFYEHFCKINYVDVDKLPPPCGGLIGENIDDLK